ncbi:APN1 (YKL114C) [Zygosaccharomyces parabailii]|uniref:Apurinic-apyrimidinic endonuclease 1 n=1 Tax=Zygosaccharomyces bailii (strain CLIB 213 / ATCC 58445 / CBS 680 / BCRC 21525 / NBRC 1098 / NCYC 1416 / NRRL Y-2227) TaxID=1333698 RepID=A0A8J2T640_ZYGB2|nr:APN1 (YKL114C) [Zygosaccharomyces parabailii]CDF89012.1 ZYBA0S03-07140g1_1 [Zygosaccharomyces bailii CLIB 213]CDH16097.1 probable DNA-(apurinic or apyrimidinic site) lyase 1 [Zygosaccharomyces bailii ISA1307]
MSKFVRSTTSRYKFGAHISAAGGISNSVTNAYNIGCNGFAMFLKSPRKWISPAYTPEEIEKFKENCQQCNYNPLTDILPHGQYFINLANPDEEKAQKAYDSLIDDLGRCEQLGIGLYNLHPGSSLKGDHEAQLKQLAQYLNKAIKETKFVKIVLENMAGTGSLIGSNLEDLKFVIDLIEDKTRIGVCVDTCHTFAAGYDLVTREAYEKFWQQFSDTIGYKYLSAVHLNDSKAPLGANRDLHEKLGEGFLGLEVFRMIAHDEHLQGLPLILETPQPTNEGYGEEVKMLEWLETLSSPDDKKLAQKNQELQDRGEKSRKDQQTKFAVKQKKGTKRKKSDSENDITAHLSKQKRVNKT